MIDITYLLYLDYLLVANSCNFLAMMDASSISTTWVNEVVMKRARKKNTLKIVTLFISKSPVIVM